MKPQPPCACPVCGHLRGEHTGRTCTPKTHMVIANNIINAGNSGIAGVTLAGTATHFAFKGNRFVTTGAKCVSEVSGCDYNLTVALTNPFQVDATVFDTAAAGSGSIMVLQAISNWVQPIACLEVSGGVAFGGSRPSDSGRVIPSAGIVRPRV